MLSDYGIEVLSICVWGSVSILPLIVAVLHFRRYRFTRFQYLFYLYNLIMCLFAWRARVSGRIDLRDEQGGIVVCNHRSAVDPAFIALATNRVVHWMVAKEYCDQPALGALLRRLDVIPTRRGGIDTKATKSAIRVAQEGGLVGMFPEGRLNDTDQLLLPGRPGAALIALKAQVPVVPCYLEGVPHNGTLFGPFYLTANTRLKVGRPIDLSAYYGRENEKQVLEHLTRRVLGEIARLAGRPDYQPQLAGRRWKPEAWNNEDQGKE